MVGGGVEGVEVVENSFDFRTARGDEAHAAEDVAAFVKGLADGMFASGVPFASGEGDVDLFRGVFLRGIGDAVFGFFNLGEQGLFCHIESFSDDRFLIGGDFAHEGTQGGKRTVASDGFRADGFDVVFGFRGSKSGLGIRDDCLNLIQQFHICFLQIEFSCFQKGS